MYQNSTQVMLAQSYFHLKNFHSIMLQGILRIYNKYNSSCSSKSQSTPREVQET